MASLPPDRSAAISAALAQLTALQTRDSGLQSQLTSLQAQLSGQSLQLNALTAQLGAAVSQLNALDGVVQQFIAVAAQLTSPPAQ